jgi:hypothetical protein
MSLLREKLRGFELLSEGVKAARRPSPIPRKTAVAVFTHAILPPKSLVAVFRPSLAVKRTLVAVCWREKPAI